MNILVFEWNTFGQKDLEDTLFELGHKVDKISYVFTDFEKDEAFERKFSELLLAKQYDFVVSFNFFQVVSKVCNSFSIKYIAWVWDSPLLNLNSRAIYYPVNYIFIFDRYLYLKMKEELKADTVYYLPLAVNVERLDRLLITEEDKKKYGSDVSFVGSLYEKRSHYNEIPKLSDYLRGYFEGIMRAQMNIHGYNFIREMLTDEIMEELYRYININPGANFIGEVKDIFADRFLNTKISSMERLRLLGLLSQYFNVTIYTDSDSSSLEYVINKGHVDYYSEMPKAFRCSKINLNFTVRTIKTGIPLRVFDILGAGGFLITNYQEELTEYFGLGEDLVVYENEEDLVDKVAYYLQHEEERRRIAENGYRKVKEYHTYQLRLREMLRIASGEPLPEAEQALAEQDPEFEEAAGRLIESLNHLIREGRLEEVKAAFHSFRRSYPKGLPVPMLSDLDLMLRISSYEQQRQQGTLFDQAKSLKEVWDRFEGLRKRLKDLESAGKEQEEEFVIYVTNQRISYTAIEFAVSELSADNVRLLNHVAGIFLRAGRREMVLPFLSIAIELEPENNETLYLLAAILYQLGEYAMAYEYIDQISIASPEVMELMERILQGLASLPST